MWRCTNIDYRLATNARSCHIAATNDGPNMNSYSYARIYTLCIHGYRLSAHCTMHSFAVDQDFGTLTNIQHLFQGKQKEKT